MSTYSREESEAIVKDLDRFGRGVMTLTELPATSQDFWRIVIELSAKAPKRTRRRVDANGVAQRLVSQVLPKNASTARREAAIAAISADDPRIRRQAVIMLRGAGEAADAALSLAAEDRDAVVRLNAVHVLSEMKSAHAYMALAKVVHFSRALAGTVAAEALIRAGSAAVPALTDLLNSQNDGARWRAVDCLTRIGTMEAKTALLKGLLDSSQDVAWRAADGLLTLGPNISRDVLRCALQQPLSYATVVALRHYAEHSSPQNIFGPIVKATEGLGRGSATLTALHRALEALENS